MKSVCFSVECPDDSFECIVNKNTKCSIVKSLNPNAAGTDGRTFIYKTINPSQLVYVMKEFKLLDRFRKQVYRFLKAFNQNVVFRVVEPKNGGLIDYQW